MEKFLNFIEKNRTWSLAIIFVLTILAYSNIFANQFVWDDPDFYQNWPALYSFESLPRLVLGEVPIQHFGVFRPLRSIIQLFIFQILGSTNLIGYHLLSLAIHLIGVWLFYWLTEKITGKRTVAFLAALFFGLHPIHTEAITYITTSIDEIGIIWALLSIFFYLKFNPKKPVRKNYIFSLIFALMAFFSYEITLILPALIILIDLFQKNFDYNKIKEKIKCYLPYFIALGFWVAMKLALAPQNRQLLFGQDVSLPLRLLTMGKVFVKYLFLLIWPRDLNVYHEIIFAQNFGDLKAILAWVFLFALVISAIILAKKIPAASFAVFWFFISLAPVSNIIPTGIIMAEKYTYLASFSICFLLAVILEKLISGQKQLYKYSAILAVLAIVIFYGAATYARNFDWKNDKTLWEKTLTQRPDFEPVLKALKQLEE